MPSTDFPDPNSDAPEIARMRRIITEYESCEDPWLKSEYLDAHGLTRDVIINYRKIVARADLRTSPTPPASGECVAHTSRRGRPRRLPSSPLLSHERHDPTGRLTSEPEHPRPRHLFHHPPSS
ncbi:hypothetical protein SUDANB176_02832 [Streptomyces sp. enrichment culture]